MWPAKGLGVLAVVTVVAGLASLAPRDAHARRAGVAAAGCDGCHRGGRAPTVTISANPPSPAVGAATTLTVTITNAAGKVGGFFLTTEGTNNGAFRGVESGTLATSAGVTHTMPRTAAAGIVTFKAEWTASVATGVDFVAYGLSGNGDNTSGGDAGGEGRLSLVSGCAGATYTIDQDGDGYGSADPAYATRKDCTRPLGYAAEGGDCDDFNATVHPGASERCDMKDNDCNGKVDDAIVYTSYCEDKDGDGHGITGGMTKTDCAPSAGFGDCAGDCNDNAKDVYPGAIEICDGHDNNCDGRFDEGVRMTCGVGWCRRYAQGCTTTCTPGEPMRETCNYFDDDCDDVIDNGTDAELCGASGLVCVLGQCIPDAGGGGPGGSGGGSGGAGGSGGGAGLGGPSGAGGGGLAPAGGSGSPGCTVEGQGPALEGGALGFVAVSFLAATLRRRRQDPLSAAKRAR